jgi:DNA-binding response OmpR family regulator
VPPLSDLTGSPVARILVADDDPTTLTLLQQVLASDGYQVDMAGSGEEALLWFQASIPDLVLLDVVMPGINGFVTCERLRLLDPHHDVPVVMLTGADDVETVDRAFAAGATDFLSKPFQWRLLLQRVRYAMRAGRLNRELRLNRSREATARRIAKLNFFHWDLASDTLSWSDDTMPLTGVVAASPVHVQTLVDLVIVAERQQAHHTIRLARERGEALDLELPVMVEGREFLLRLVGQAGRIGADRQVISGVLQDLTDQRRTEQLAASIRRADDTVGRPPDGMG